MPTPDLMNVTWRKSTYSGNYACVEVADLDDGNVAVRDTKDKGNGPILFFTRNEWNAFIAGAKNGEFD